MLTRIITRQVVTVAYTTGFAGRMESGSVDRGILDRTARIARLRQLAVLLDSAIRLPGGFRIGADGIIGLAPGIGDAGAAARAAGGGGGAGQRGRPRRRLW